MPLDPLDPTHLALSPEQRTADKFATLDRRLGVSERQSVNRVIRNRTYLPANGTVNTTAAGPVDLGGPSVQFSAVDGTFIDFFVEAELFCNTAGATPFVYVVVTSEPTNAAPIHQQVGAGIVINTWTRFRGDANGGSPSFGQWLSLPATPGDVTVGVLYGTTGGIASFRNRRLWVQVR